MPALRYGIIGGGFITGFQLRALEQVRGVEVAGLVSRTAPEALAAGARRVFVGHGGSATTDGGLAALRSLSPTARLAGVELVAAVLWLQERPRWKSRRKRWSWWRSNWFWIR